MFSADCFNAVSRLQFLALTLDTVKVLFFFLSFFFFVVVFWLFVFFVNGCSLSLHSALLDVFAS